MGTISSTEQEGFAELHKKAVEKWLRQKQAEYERQCKMNELNMQERLQTEQQKKMQQQRCSDTPPSSTAAPPARPTETAKSHTFLDTNEVTVAEPSVLSEAKPEQNEKKSCRDFRDAMNASNVRCEEWLIVDSVTEENASNENMATHEMELLNDDNTVPFIARYRRDATNEVTVSEPSVLSEAQSEQNEKKSCRDFRDAMNASNVRCEEWSIVDYVTEENALNKNIVAHVMELLDDDNTVPFIARYRRGVTQGMEEDKLLKVKNSYERAKLIKQRAVSIIKTVDKQGRWTPELHAFVYESKSLLDLEWIDSIFKVAKTEDFGLGKIAEAVIKNKDFVSLSRFVNPTVVSRKSVEHVKFCVAHVLANTINKDIRIFDIIKKLRSNYDMGVETRFAVTNEPVTLERELRRQEYILYNNFKSTDKLIASSDISKIRMGEAEKILTVKIIVPPQFGQDFKDCCSQLHIAAIKASPLHKELINAAIDYMYDKWARPSIEKWTKQEIDEKADIATMEKIVRNFKELLLAPSLRGHHVIGIFLISQSVCKLAAISERGDYLDSETMYLNNNDDPSVSQDAENKLVRMVKKYKCTTLAVGNGAAQKGNERFVSQILRQILDLEGKKLFLPFKVSFRLVDEAGLLQQFHTFSHPDSSEFPTVAAVSIARRLQDPIAEFVKIEPKHLVEEIYQRIVPEEQLTATLNDVIVEVVSSVGVDLNTASAALLRRVAGLDEAKAKSIVKRRDSAGPFTNRNDLLNVKGIGVKTFVQCAGFVRIMPETALGKDGQRALQDSFNHLDQTSIHPDSYEVTEAFLKAAKCNADQFGRISFI